MCAPARAYGMSSTQLAYGGTEGLVQLLTWEGDEERQLYGQGSYKASVVEVMSGTDLGYGAMPALRILRTPTRCPVLTSGMLLPGEHARTTEPLLPSPLPGPLSQCQTSCSFLRLSRYDT
eukprot:3941502-Rhodomonas_salina.1